MRVLELKGPKSLRALNVFQTLMLGLKMLPAYMAEGYEDFLERIEEMPEVDQEKMIREALLFVELETKEIEALGQFVADKNGIPIGSAQIKNMTMKEIFEMVVLVCKAVAKEIDCDWLNPEEKKNLKICPLT